MKQGAAAREAMRDLFERKRSEWGDSLPSTLSNFVLYAIAVTFKRSRTRLTRAYT